MLDRLWEALVQAAIALFLPLVCNHIELTSDLFFNGAYQQSQGVEWVADQLLAPCHYLFLGQTISQTEDGDWEFRPRFDYSHAFEIKATLSGIVALPSLVLGALVKSICLLDSQTRARYHSIIQSYNGERLQPPSLIQQRCSQILPDPFPFISKNLPRKPGAENHLSTEKKVLLEISQLFNEAKISWWVDCGTCLGVYRHSGVIPWDGDLDIAVFQSEFENVRRLLHRLDRQKYLIQDWSSRDFPNSLIKIFVRENHSLIDIYFFDYQPQTNEIRWIWTFDKSLVFPEWCKIRERRFTVPISLDKVFPLKKASLDGVEVFVPKETEQYLQRYYGENLAPAKIYDPNVDEYVKDLSHPYWQRAFVH